MEDDFFHLHQDDVKRMLLCKTHIGSTNCNFQMEQYVFKRNDAGVHVINLRKTWEKLLLAARAIAAIQPATDVFVVSSRNVGQRAVLKFARYIGATPVAGRFTPGAFTNQSQKAFQEPRILVICDPIADHQPITESSYVNLPVIAFCDTDSPLRFVDIAIPCNNKAKESVGIMWWMLAREVKRLRGEISRATGWDVMPDMFILREAEEIEKQEGLDQGGVGQELSMGGAGAANAYGGGAPGESQRLDISNVEDWSAEPLSTNQPYGDMSGFQAAGTGDTWDQPAGADNWGSNQASAW